MATEREEGHTKTGNCWYGKPADQDACEEHDEPRGECSECWGCEACDAEFERARGEEQARKDGDR